MSGIKNADASSNRSLSESQFRWRAAFPVEPARGGHEQGSQGKMKTGSLQEPSQQFHEQRQTLGLNIPSSVLAAYDRISYHREQPRDRRRSEFVNEIDASSTITLYDYPERVLHQEGNVDEREYRRRPGRTDQLPPRDRRPTSPPRLPPPAGPPESVLVKANSHPHQQLLPRPPAQPPPAGPPAPKASLDLQLAPPSNNSHIHPTVLQNSVAALLPIRSLYEQAWFQTVSNVQNEMTRMHRELGDALDRERAARNRLTEEKKVLQQEVERIQVDLRNARRDSDKFKVQCDRFVADNERLRQAAKDQLAQRGGRDDQAKEAARLYIDEQLSDLKARYGEQMEKQRAEAERALEEQKTMFEKERRELHKIAVAHERDVQRSSSGSGSTLTASDDENVLSPLYDQGPHKKAVQQELIQSDRPRGCHMSVSSGSTSPSTSSRASPQLFFGSHSRYQVTSYRPLSPSTPSIPRKESFSSTTPDNAHVNRQGSLQTDNAMDVDVETSSLSRSPIPPPDAGQSAIPSTLMHHRLVSSQTLPHSARHPSSSRSPSIPLASIPRRPLTSSPLPIEDTTPRQEQTASSLRLSSLPVTLPSDTSRHASMSSQNTTCSTPPMGSLTSRPYSRPTSRPPSRPVSRNSVIEIDISPVVPHLAVPKELNPPSRQQQETLSSPKPTTEPQSQSSPPSPAQAPPPPALSLPPRQLQEQSPQQQQPAPLPPPLQPQLPQPSKQLPVQAPPAAQPQPRPPSQNGQQQHQKPHQKQFPIYSTSQFQTGVWVSYPYSYQYHPPPPPAIPPPAPAAPQSTPASASSSFQRKRDRVEYEEGSGPGERAKAKVKLEDGSGEGVAAVAAAVTEVKEVKRTNKIGINHMDLLYETRGPKMICRMCRIPGKDEQKTTPTATFPVDAKWVELIGHCQSVHPKSCADLEKLRPSQVQELRQRMQSGKLTGYTLK